MPNLPISQLPLATSGSPESWMAIVNYDVDPSGITNKIPFSAVTAIPDTVVQGFFSQTGNSTPISGTTSELSLVGPGVGTLSVPANTFEVGNSYRVIMGGILSANSNDDIRIRVKTNTIGGSITLADSGFQNLAGTSGNEVFILELNFTVRQIGGSGVASIVTLGIFTNFKTNTGANTGFAFNNVYSTDFDTTISNTLDITAEWDNASASNIIYSDIFNLRKTY